MSVQTLHQPPLKVWIFAGLLVVALIALLANVALHITEPASTGRLNLQRLAQATSSQVHVVAIGTSKTRAAIDFDRFFAQRLAAAGRKIVFHRISWSGALYADLEPALAALRDAPPDILLVESDLLLFDRQHEVVDRWQDRWRGNVSKLTWWVKGQAGQVDHGNYAYDNRDDYAGMEAYCRHMKSPQKLRAYGESVKTWKLSSPAQREAYLAFLRPMQDAGTKIVLLELPRSAAADGVFLPLLTQQMQALRAQIVQTQGFAYWAPQTPPDSAYCDHRL